MPTVLIVDDHPMLAEAVAALVKQLGCEPIVAASGAEGIDVMRRAKPDLVVLDYHMPELSGLDVLKRLTEDQSLPRLKVVMFSADDQCRDDALRLGAVAVVPKTQMFDLVPLVQSYVGCP